VGAPIRLSAEISDTSLEGERKTVTALFADIKGSMDLIENLDPENPSTRSSAPSKAPACQSIRSLSTASSTGYVSRANNPLLRAFSPRFDGWNGTGRTNNSA
jgi:hypothetical protein